MKKDMDARGICTKKKTKRGHLYNIRSTKIAHGFSKVLADRGWREKDTNSFGLASPKYRILLALAVRGTTAKMRLNLSFYTKWVMVPHPLDKSYTKRMLVLNDKGKALIKRRRKNKMSLNSTSPL